MNARLSWFLLAAIALGAAVKPAMAQEPPNVTDYIDPATAYHTSNFDYVDPLNQRVALDIPLVVDQSQRGNLNFTYSLRYASTNAWYAVYEYGTYPYLQWQPPNNILTGPVFSMDGKLTWTSSRPAVALDDTGAQHYLGTLSGNQNAGCPYTAESVDGSGIQAVCSTFTLINRQGVQFQDDGQIEDTNGNLMTFGGGPNVSQMTDTVGRVWSYSHGGGNTSICPTSAYSADLWQAPGTNGNTRNFTFCLSLVPISTNFGNPIARDYNSTVLLMTALVLPDGTSWQFGYDSYGDLTSVQLPTGGTVSYSWTGNDAGSQPWCLSSGTADCEVRTLTSRTSTDGNTQSTWQYNNFTVTDPALNDTVYTPNNPNDVADDGRVNSIQYLNGRSGSGSVMKTVNYGYQTLDNPYPNDMGDPNQVTYLPASTEPQWANGQTSETFEAYDSGFSFMDDNDGSQHQGVYGAVEAIYNRDYGSGGSPGPLLSINVTGYYAFSYPAYLSANLLDLPYYQVTTDGNWQTYSQTDLLLR